MDRGRVRPRLLTALQFLVAWSAVRWQALRKAVTAMPVVLVSDGAIYEAAVLRSRLTRSQLMQAIRSGGYGDPALVGAVILEPNGTLSVIGKDSLGVGSALPGHRQD